jgi:hypothetical protein
MKSDVKAIRVTGTGSVFAGRTRLRGIILSNSTASAGSITLQDGNSVTQFMAMRQQVMCLHLIFQKMEFYL